MNHIGFYGSHYYGPSCSYTYAQDDDDDDIIPFQMRSSVSHMDENFSILTALLLEYILCTTGEKTCQPNEVCN